MNKARVFMQSTEATGMLHPSGDGDRVYIVLSDGEKVKAFYPPILDSAEYPKQVWAAFKPNATPVDDAFELKQYIENKVIEMDRQSISFDRESTAKVIAALCLIISPPPPPRVRVRSVK